MTTESNYSIRKHPLLYLLLLLSVILNFTGITTPLFTGDQSTYALLSKSMVVKNNFWELYLYGEDWLDKPHFPFWITAFSFQLFGFSTFAYKLPAILFFFASVYYTYRLAKELYSEKVAFNACLILLTAQHIVLFNNDVRAEPFLMPLIIGGLYHFRKILIGGKNYHLIIGTFLAACAMMTKGLFALIPILMGLFAEAYFKKQLKVFVSRAIAL